MLRLLGIALLLLLPCCAGDAGPQAWRILHDGASSKNKVQRAAAIRSLSLLWRGSEAEKLALAALDDREPMVRQAAVEVLGNLQVRSSVPNLVKKLRDYDAGVELAAAKALTQMNDPAALDYYRRVLTGEKHTDHGFVGEGIGMINTVPKVSQLAAMTASGFVPFGGPVYMILQMAMHDGATDARVGAARALALDPGPEAHAALVKSLGDRQPLVQAAALESLARQGDVSLLPRLEAMLLDAHKLPANSSADNLNSLNKALLEGDDHAGHAVVRYTVAAAYLRLKQLAPAPDDALASAASASDAAPLGLVAGP